jgi:predicted nucleotide-binding protein
VPYRSGRPITTAGKTFRPEEIERIQINYTEQDSSVLFPIVREEQRAAAARSGVVMIGGPTYAWYVAARGENVTDEMIAGPPGYQADEVAAGRSGAVDPRNVMVVHGRNRAARDAMFEFLRAIGLEPLEWDKLVAATGDAAPYIGDILDEGFARAQAVVVLLTPDDEARVRSALAEAHDPPHEVELTPQARPNVLFEAGMAFGRHPRRVVMVELGRLRPFSDVAGRHVVRLDDSSQRRQELAERLRNAGCAVDTSGTDWHRAGAFEVSVE